MLDLGEYTPRGEMGPVRGEEDGAIRPGRLTTTEEQRSDARKWILTKMAAAGVTESRTLIHWGKLDPTVLTMTTTIEHIGGDPRMFISSVTETMPSGAEVKGGVDVAMRRTIAEVTEIANRNQL